MDEDWDDGTTITATPIGVASEGAADFPQEGVLNRLNRLLTMIGVLEVQGLIIMIIAKVTEAPEGVVAEEEDAVVIRELGHHFGATRSFCGALDLENSQVPSYPSKIRASMRSERSGIVLYSRATCARQPHAYGRPADVNPGPDYRFHGSLKTPRGCRGGFRNDRNDRNNDNGWGENGGTSNDGGWGEADGDSGKTSSGGWGGNDDGGFGDGGRGRGRGRGRGGRGGRGGGRDGDDGGFRGHRDEEGGGDAKNGDDKPREIYIPPDRGTDEDLFTSTITSGINFIKLDDIEVNVSGEDVPTPITSFETSGLRSHLLDNIKRSGYDKPTPIQKYAMPIILGGRDLMGCAQTGSGKTAAFLLPVINKLLASQDPPITENNCCQPRVVIVSPTRELTIQIFEQAKKFAYNSIVKTVVAYGGVSVGYQIKHVVSGCHILVATPGRLNDFVKRGHISFASVQFFILDCRADRMLDMGFLPTVEQMLGDSTMIATGERQTLMFSATFPEEIQHLAGKFLHNYVFVAVGIVGSASTDVEQVFHQVSKSTKEKNSSKCFKKASGNERTVVFVETKRNADFLATLLSEGDIKTTSIHGDRLQREREQALWDFKKGNCNILVATGVAARGLDIEGIQHVINYDLPNSIGRVCSPYRTYRESGCNPAYQKGNRGKATSFFDSAHDSALAGNLGRILKQAGQEVPDWLSEGGFSRGGADNDGFGGRDIRGDDFGKAQNFSTQPAEEVEEEW
ncbi:hypothetical protein NQ317_011049 [Molorchus minor]|uniref:RNA helicase n=1 Tax=Molorchus minor TaxID=1323400 RepID=A0ABQ9J5B9_9CUCU|nr:hypothetical protein NQ317_011049 [Molorchus minor]